MPNHPHPVFPNSLIQETLQCIYISGLGDVRGDIVKGEDFPVHFCKTIIMDEDGDLLQDTQLEFERSKTIHKLLPNNTPCPFVYTPTEFHSELIDATAWASLSPWDRGQNKPLGQLETTLTPDEILPLWEGLNSTYLLVQRLHQSGYSHGDLHRNNVLFGWQTRPWKAYLIDFEFAAPLATHTKSRTQQMDADLHLLKREASQLLRAYPKLPQHKLAHSCQN